MNKTVKTIALELQPCCGKRSGIGTYTYELAKRLKSDDEIQFCGNLFNFCGRNDNSQALQGINMDMNVSRVFPYGVYRRLWRALPISYDNLFSQKSDGTVFFNYIVPPKIRGKIITTVYDMTYVRFPETMDARNLRRISAGMERSAKRSDRIITISEFSKREIIDLLGVPKEKVSVIYSAPSLSEETADSEDTLGKYGITKPYILYVGTIEPRKNLVRLIHAFEMLKRNEKLPYRLVLAGGKGWQNEEIYRAAKESPFAEDIIFTGYISNSERNCLYQNAELFVFPSLYEGFGMPPLEAMHWGCPVVTSDAASMPEICGDAAALVNPLDEEDIVKGIMAVLSDKEYAESLRKKGYEQEKKFTWETSAQQLISVCKEVLGE
jgi:glycosyltransferase involved in cell wall biosynthesis